MKFRIFWFSEDMQMWNLGLCLSGGLGSARLTVGLHLKSLSHPKQFYDSVSGLFKPCCKQTAEGWEFVLLWLSSSSLVKIEMPSALICIICFLPPLSHHHPCRAQAQQRHWTKYICYTQTSHFLLLPVTVLPCLTHCHWSPFSLPFSLLLLSQSKSVHFSSGKPGLPPNGSNSRLLLWLTKMLYYCTYPGMDASLQLIFSHRAHWVRH